MNKSMDTWNKWMDEWNKRWSKLKMRFFFKSILNQSVLSGLPVKFYFMHDTPKGCAIVVDEVGSKNSYLITMTPIESEIVIQNDSENEQPKTKTRPRF